MRQLRLKKKSISGAQIVLKVFPGVFSSQKKLETYLQRVHTTKIEHCSSTQKYQILRPPTSKFTTPIPGVIENVQMQLMVSEVLLCRMGGVQCLATLRKLLVLVNFFQKFTLDSNVLRC